MKIKFTTMGRITILLVAGIFISWGANSSIRSGMEPADGMLAQDTRVTVNGVITDAADNSPLAGVSVIELGTSRGVTTDAGGAYNITVAANATLSFSYLGYTAQTAVVGNRSRIDVQLQSSAINIEDVVVEIGYGGSQRKQDLSMSIATVKVDDIAKGRATDLGSLLQGKVPGMNVFNSGDPVNDASITIRGRGSRSVDGSEQSGTGVLVVVDGIPGAPYSIEDIETVTVLKDAASAAIYGSQVGSSGVVLVTTKKAAKGTVRVSANASNGMAYVSNLPTLLTSEQFNEVWRKAASVAGQTVPSFADPGSSVYSWTNQTRTDWLDEIFRVGIKQHYGASISGGSDKMQSILSLSYDDNTGVIRNTWSKEFNAKLNTDFTPTDWLRLGERVNFEYRDSQGNINTNFQGPIMGAMWMPRSATVYAMDQDGNYILDAKGNKTYGGLYPDYLNVPDYPKNVMNPVAELDEMRRRYPSTRIMSTTYLEVKPISKLTLRTDFTIDLGLSQRDEFWPVRTEAGSFQRGTNFRQHDIFRNLNWLSETTATYANLFGKHHISAMAGLTASSNNTRNWYMYTEDYEYQEERLFLWSYINGNNAESLRDNIRINTMRSLLGRVGWSYDDRYFATATIRRDESSKLSMGNRTQVYPAVSASWKLTSEQFFKDLRLDFLDLVKVRASYGELGNVDGFDWQVFSSDPINGEFWACFGPDGSVHMYPSYYGALANPYAKWETTKQTGVGLDLTLLDNKLDITVDWYNKKTSDLIERLPTPDQVGVSGTTYGNIGTVINKGWELSFDYNNSTRTGLNYGVWGMLNFNDNEITEYGNHTIPVMHSAAVDNQELIANMAGYGYYSFYLYKTAGIFRSQEEIDNYVNGGGSRIQPNAKPGDLKYIDLDGNGSISANDREMMGNYMPKVNYSFGGTVAYKGFDLSVMLQGVQGNKIYNGLKQMMSYGRREGGNLMDCVLDSYDLGGNYPRLGLLNDSNGTYTNPSDYFLEDGSFLRLKNVTVGYTLPKSVMNSLRMKEGSVRFYVSADNLATFTNYSGIDPEVGSFGVDRGVYPISKFVNFGVNINF